MVLLDWYIWSNKLCGKLFAGFVEIVKNIEVNFIFMARLSISLRVNLEDILHSL